MASNEVSISVDNADDANSKVDAFTEMGTQTRTTEVAAPTIRELRDEIEQKLKRGEEKMKKLHEHTIQLQTTTQTVIKMSEDSIAFLKECNTALKSADEKLARCTCDGLEGKLNENESDLATAPIEAEVSSSERQSGTLTTSFTFTDERLYVDLPNDSGDNASDNVKSEVKKISYQLKTLPANVSKEQDKGSMSRNPSFTTLYAERQSAVPLEPKKVDVQMICNHRISVLNSVKTKRFRYPYQLVNGIKNELIISDRDSHHLVVFDEQLQSSFVFGTRGTGKGTFYNPTGLAVDRVFSYLYVADHNNIVQQFKMTYDPITNKLSSHGLAYVKSYGKKGYGEGELQCPCGLAFSNKLGLFVCDYGNHRIQVFAKDKTYSFGQRGQNPREFTEPHSIAINRDKDKVFVSDHSNNRIQVFKPDGTFVTIIVDSTIGPKKQQLQYPRGIHYTSDGRLLVSCTYTHCILEFTEDGTYQSTIEGIIQPGGIVLRHDKKIIVTSNVNQALIVLTTT